MYESDHAGGRSPSGLQRIRLLEPVLDRSGPALIVVSAPPGSGKTTLLRQAAALSPVAAVRYRATDDDDDEAALVAHIGRAVAAGLGVPVAAEARSVAQLVSTIEGAAPEGLLLMDDLHVLGAAAERALDRLVLRRPPGWRLVLGCRRAPVADLPVLRLSSDVHEIDGDDLRFRSWEVGELFDVVYRSPLPPESVAALTRRTAGWAAGLALFHLATTGKTSAGRCRAVDELGAGSRLLRSYLTRNVLAALPDHRRSFLVRTCALGVLSGPLCDELLGRTHSLSVLEELADEQLFTTGDEDGLTFRYHHVLQSHLEVALVEELGPASARAWYARCAAVLESAGLVRDALRAHARAEDWASMGRLLQRGHVPAGGPAPSWQDLVPIALRRRDPWFVRADAKRLLRDGDLAGACTGLRAAAELSDERAFQQQCRQERAIVDAWLQPRPAARPDPPAPVSGRWAERLRAAVRAAPDRCISPGTRLRHAEDGLADAVALLLAGRVERAKASFEQVIDVEPDDVGVQIALDLGSMVAELLLARPRADAVDRLEGAVLRAETEDHPWLGRLCRALVAAVRQRDADFADLLTECEHHGDSWGAALIQLIAGASAMVGTSAGSSTAAAQVQLRDAGERFRRLDAAVLELWARYAWVLLLSRSGMGSAIETAREVELAARRIQLPTAGLLARTISAAPTRRSGPQVALTCLGGFCLRVGSAELDLTSVRPRARTVLRYLALHLGRDVHRERLVDELWPGVPLAAGTRSLQVAVSSLRGALDSAGLDGPAVLRRHAEAYRLALPAGSTVDIVDLRRAVAAGDAAQAADDLRGAVRIRRAALALHGGELLPEDGPAEWVVGERERLRLLAATTATALARGHRELGEPGHAIEAAQWAVELDPWSDLGWRLLIELHVQVGDRGAAARCSSRHERVVHEMTTSDTGSFAVPARPRAALPAQSDTASTTSTRCST